MTLVRSAIRYLSCSPGCPLNSEWLCLVKTQRVPQLQHWLTGGEYGIPNKDQLQKLAEGGKQTETHPGDQTDAGWAKRGELVVAGVPKLHSGIVISPYVCWWNHHFVCVCVNVNNTIQNRHILNTTWYHYVCWLDHITTILDLSLITTILYIILDRSYYHITRTIFYHYCLPYYHYIYPLII